MHEGGRAVKIQRLIEVAGRQSERLPVFYGRLPGLLMEVIWQQHREPESPSGNSYERMTMMKRSLVVTCLLLIGIVIGATGVLILKGQASSPPHFIGTSPYDTRPCRVHPSRGTCDGKMPVAAGYADLAAGQEGNEACLDGTLQTVQQLPIHVREHRGTLLLRWSPLCESYYAETQVGTATVIGMILARRDAQGRYLTVSSLLSNGLSETAQSWSPLLFRPGDHHMWIRATAIITWPDGRSDSFSLDRSPEPGAW